MGYIELNVLNDETIPAMGIDLGTTNSLAAIWQNDRPVILRPENGTGSVPSALYATEDGELLVGRKAREHAVVDPANTVFSVKRFMGRSLAEVANELPGVPCPVTEGANGVVTFELRGRKWTPQELSARILMRVHQLGCKALEGREINRAVITVPAYFDDVQRQATANAAKIAGIEVLRIINEPTAASLAYGLDQKGEGTVVVYDLGGGTFDVSILSIEEGVFRVLSTAGDTHLGGDDFDRALVELVRTELEGKLGKDELADPAFLQAARLAAERCKMELTEHPSAELHLVVPSSGVNWRREVTRAELDASIRPLIDRTLDACRRTLADAGLETSQIDEVVLVGGSTRVPAVRAAVEGFFGRKPHTELNPDEVVALGAAVQAHVLTGGSRDILLMDVTPLSLGLETMGGAVAKIIHRNSTIPCQATEGFTTYADNQTGIDFNIVQGERELASDCRSLGHFKLTGIPPMPAGMAKVAVRFHIDANGLLTVTAKEESTGTTARIEVQPMSGLTDDAVETMLASAYEHAETDFEVRHAADLKVELGTMLAATRKGLDSGRDALDRETIEDIEDVMRRAETARDDDAATSKQLQRLRDEFEERTMPLAAVLMDSVAKSALAGRSLGDL